MADDTIISQPNEPMVEPEPTSDKPQSPKQDLASRSLCAVVVDDEPANRDILMRLLQHSNINVQGAATGAEALQLAESLGSELQLMMLDHQLPDQNGMTILRIMQEKHPHVRVVMATVDDDRVLIRQAFDAGCVAFLVKPHGFRQLMQLLKNINGNPTELDRLIGLVFNQHGTRPWRHKS